MRAVESAPVRPLRLSHRALTGKVRLKSGGMAGFESSLERDWLIALDFDRRVRRILEQPYTLYYVHEGAKRRYTPDVLADYDDKQAAWTVVYEVKPHEDLKENWKNYRPRFKAAVHDCQLKGWRFRIVTERDIRTPYVANVKFLRRYAAMPDQAEHRFALLYTLKALGRTTPQALIAASWNDLEHQAVATAQLWRLVYGGEIAACLLAPLTMKTPIWMP